MNFTTADTKNWKILYKVGKQEDKNTKALEDKIKKFIANENINKLSYTFDIYTEKENFITIQGLKSEVYAKNIIAVMKDDKKYKVSEPAIVISSDNYKVVQIKKNLEEYLAPPKAAVVPAQPIVPQQAIPQPVNPNQATPKPGAPKRASATRPPGGIPNMEDKDNPNSNSPQKQ
jgi:hypothetical protein